MVDVSEKMDYKKIGLKCGIEIHQRLDTNKLFCDCSSHLRDDVPDVVIRREMRAVAGETGVVDAAASHEMHKDEYYIYEAYSDTTCLVELDEEPPHKMNEEALHIVLQVSKMLDAAIVDEIQIMRKTVVNGSNTSGFQRTSLVAIDGYIDVGGKKVSIPTISIEEESAKDISKGVDKAGRRYVTFRLDRLGIPLIEIGTDPDIDSPEMCKETAEKIGMILRSTGRVARGIGTIRQDVNVSIAKGRRIEIKGAQDLKMIPLLVENEAKRQLSLVELRDKIMQRAPNFSASVSCDVTDILKTSGCKFVQKSVSQGASALAFTLPGFSSILGTETQPGKRLGTELSEYAKVKTGIGGMIHSDENLSKYPFSEEEISSVTDSLKKQGGMNEKDAFVIIVAKTDTAKRARSFVLERAKICLEGVPGEVRKANPDGTTSYLRPMPGAARMYPETDIKPIVPDVSDIVLPELITEKAERYSKDYRLSGDLARDLSRSSYFTLFEESVKKYDHIKPAFIAETIISLPKIIKRKYNLDTELLSEENFDDLFSRLNNGKITKDVVEEILVSICKGKPVNYEKYAPLDDVDLEKEILKIVSENKDKIQNPKAMIGKVMSELKGRAEGKKIMELFRKQGY